MKRSQLRDGTFQAILQLPHGDFHKDGKRQVRQLMGRSSRAIRKPLIYLIDDCVAYSWCGKHILQVLMTVYRDAGGTHDELMVWMPERNLRHQ